MTTHYRTPRSGLLCAALATLMAGCAVGPDFVRPPASTSQGYDQTSTPTQLQMVDAAPDNWWQQFQSAQLDHLVDTALRNNPGLTAAEATLRQSEAERRAGIGLYFPNLSLGLNAQRELSAPAKLGVASAGSIFNLYALGATVSYTVDLFGGNRRTVEALTANVDYSRYRLNAARLALAGNVVDTALAHAAYDEQVAITQRMVAAERTQLQLIAAQVQAGVLPKSTELAAQSLLDGTVANLPALQEKAAASRHLLATLLNSEPAEAQPPLPCWSDLQQPAALPLTLPSTLVRQRPDILAAEASLHAATANVGVATAN